MSRYRWWGMDSGGDVEVGGGGGGGGERAVVCGGGRAEGG